MTDWKNHFTPAQRTIIERAKYHQHDDEIDPDACCMLCVIAKMTGVLDGIVERLMTTDGGAPYEAESLRQRIRRIARGEFAEEEKRRLEAAQRQGRKGGVQN